MALDLAWGGGGAADDLATAERRQLLRSFGSVDACPHAQKWRFPPATFADAVAVARCTDATLIRTCNAMGFARLRLQCASANSEL